MSKSVPGAALGVLSLAMVLLAGPLAAQRPSYDGEAPVAYMVDLASGAILFDRDSSRRIPPASMAKMMTAHVAFDLIEEGELTMDQECAVRPETWQRWSGPGGGSTMFLRAGERVSVENLLYGIVTVSGNDASVVLAECISGTETAFAALMNRKAEELGLDDSNFGNATGWPDEGRTYTTARDLARLAVSTIRRYPEMYAQFYGRREFTWGETNGGQPITQPNRNPLLGQIRGADGLKTGHTEEAGYCFTGSAERDGRRLVMVVAGLDSYDGRISESRRFIEWGFNAWELDELLARGERIGTAQVQLGSASEVGLVAPRNLAITVPRASGGERRYSIVYEGPIRAPIEQGQVVAHLVIRSPGLPTQRLPLAAEEAVGERGFFGRAWAGLKSLFG